MMGYGALHKILLGALLSVLLAGVCFYPVKAEASAPVNMNPGQSKTMKLPEGWNRAAWSSSKKTVARVNSKGVVRAAAPGKAVLTAKNGKRTKKYTIKVKKVQLSHSSIRMKQGETKKLTAKYAVGAVSWSAKGKAVKVDSKGLITAQKEGSGTVTASVFGKTYSCKVNVQSRKPGETPAAHPIQITAGKQTFSAELYDNETVRAFLKKLPMTITMEELNGNEKYYYFSKSLPADARKQNTIHTGDIMLYGSDCLVLFYDDFSTSYSYTPMGSMRNPEGLKEALGRGNVRVTFALE